MKAVITRIVPHLELPGDLAVIHLIHEIGLSDCAYKRVRTVASQSKYRVGQLVNWYGDGDAHPDCRVVKARFIHGLYSMGEIEA